MGGPSQGLNALLDSKVNNYFDNQGFPYEDTMITEYNIRLPSKYPNSVVKDKTIQKLNDIGFYLLSEGLRHVPSVDNPDPQIAWQPIVWTSTPLRPYFSLMDGQSGSGAYRGRSNFGGFDDVGKQSSPGTSDDTSDGKSKQSSGGSKNSRSGNNTSSSCENPTGGCGQPCPLTCVGLAMQTSSPAASSSSSNWSTDAAQATGLSESELESWFELLESEGEVLEIGALLSRSQSTLKKKRGFKVTIAPVKEPYDFELDTYLNDEWISYYFDPKTGMPTQEFLDTFTEYTQGQSPMDQDHKNKLRDCIYYVLEVIIAGLPREKDPRYYVEWQPLRRIMNRSS
jgi:hypothetical protein